MKTRIVLILLACSSAWLICACGEQKPERDGTGDNPPAPYFFTNILKVKELKLRASDGNAYSLGKTDRTALHLLLSGDMYSQYSKATFDEFKKLANKIGDTESKTGYVHATPVDNKTTESAISGLEIKALSQYDAAHPTGSSLKDIVRINYESFDHVFNKALKPTNFGSQYHAMYTIEPEENMSIIKHPALEMGKFVGEREYKGGLLMSIEFLQKPSTPKQQLEISLFFENGQELKKEISLDILELEK